MKDFNVGWLAITCCARYNVNPITEKVRLLRHRNLTFLFVYRGKLNVGVD